MTGEGRSIAWAILDSTLGMSNSKSSSKYESSGSLIIAACEQWYDTGVGAAAAILRESMKELSVVLHLLKDVGCERMGWG